MTNLLPHIRKYCSLSILCCLLSQPLYSSGAVDNDESLFADVKPAEVTDHNRLKKKIQGATFKQVQQEEEKLKTYIAHLLLTGQNDLLKNIISELKNKKHSNSHVLQAIFSKQSSSFLRFLVVQWKPEPGQNNQPFLKKYNELVEMVGNDTSIYLSAEDLVECCKLNDLKLFKKFMKMGEKQHQKSSNTYWLNGANIARHFMQSGQGSLAIFIRSSTFLSQFLQEWYGKKITNKAILKEVINQIGPNHSTQINILEKDVFKDNDKKDDNLSAYTLFAEACYKDKEVAMQLLPKIEEMYRKKGKESVAYLNSTHIVDSGDDSSDDDSSDKESSSSKKKKKVTIKNALMGALTNHVDYELLYRLLSFNEIELEEAHIQQAAKMKVNLVVLNKIKEHKHLKQELRNIKGKNGGGDPQQIDILKVEVNKLKKDKQNIEEEKKKLEEKIDAINNSKKEKKQASSTSDNESTKKLIEQNNSLKDNLKKEQEKVTKLRKEMGDLKKEHQKKVTNLKKEKHSIQERLENQNRGTGNEQALLESEKDKNQNLTVQLNRYQDKINQQKNRIDSLNEEIGNLTATASTTDVDSIKQKLQAAEAKAKKRGQTLAFIIIFASIAILSFITYLLAYNPKRREQ